MDALARRWRGDCTAASPSADVAVVDAIGADLLARWAEPHRHYHDAVHLTEVLSAVDLLCSTVRPVDQRTHTVAALAAWFHDAVYAVAPASGADGPASGAATEPPGNEVASAELARTELARLGVAEEVIERVAAVVLDTVDHDLPESGVDTARRVFHDADLWVLAAPVQRFDDYCRQVRAEFRHVPARDYAGARSAVLRPFLARGHVYVTAHARSTWESAARENLARELTRLAG